MWHLETKYLYFTDFVATL